MSYFALHLFQYFANQLYIIFTILYDCIDEIPDYRIAFIYSDQKKEEQYIFNKADFDIMNQIDKYNKEEHFLYEWVLQFHLNDYSLYIIFDIKKEQYINLLLVHIFKAYFSMKEKKNK